MERERERERERESKREGEKGKLFMYLTAHEHKNILSQLYISNICILSVETRVS